MDATASRKKIVILDAYATNPGDIPWDPIAALGDLTIYDRSEPEQIIERIGDAEIVISSKVVIGREVFEACPNLEYIGLLSTGFNVIDIEAAREHGVSVCNVPDYGTEAVAQMAFALLLEVTNMVGMHSEAVYEGKWQNAIDWCFWLKPHMELWNKTIGIVGFGRIGQAAGRIANGFGMNVLGFTLDPDPALENERTRLVDSLDEVWAKADILLVACPLNDQTRGIICRENIQKMKDGVIIINIARGPLVVEEDLVEALESGKVWGAGVDVAATEPIRADNPLLHAKNLYITPHIAWCPLETRERMLRMVEENLRGYLEGNRINCVNA